MATNQKPTQELIALSVSHKTTPIEVREKFAIPEQEQTQLYRALHNVSGVEECALLNTCNRIEVYAAGRSIHPKMLMVSLCEFYGVEYSYFMQYCETFYNNEAVEHLFHVCCGLESQMLGETEIFGQVKQSFQQAQEARHIGACLNRCFQKGFQNAKWVRTHTQLGRGHVSLGNIATELAGRIFGDLVGVRILLIGTGGVGQQTVKALYSRGARSITVASRTLGRARLLAAEYEGVAIDFEQIGALLRYFDIVLCATNSPHAIMTHQMVRRIMQLRPEDPFFMIDQAVPRDVEDSIRNLINVYLYNLDDLAAIASENLRSRQKEIRAAKQVSEDKARDTWNTIAYANTAYSSRLKEDRSSEHMA